ncbi:cation:proton antiporter [bacterium]|nr:cation:proton antiporter [bacterium]
MLFKKMKQPPVMGEVIGGILLGPSVFGYFFPEVSGIVFHTDSISFLKHIAEIGILLYLFSMGLEIDLPRLKQSAKSALLISHFSIVLPFALGVALAYQIHAGYAPAGIGVLEFSLFIGVSLSITAFPVLARILSDSPLHKTRLGDLALTCAAIDDITAWCLVALVSGVMKSSVSGAMLTLVFTVVYIVLMALAVRPYVEKIVAKIQANTEHISEAMLAFVILGALGSAAITEMIGIHGLFGAFMFGAIIPHDSIVARDVTSRLQDFVRILFLPAFFAITGLKTQLGLIAETQEWALCAIVIALAIIGKFGGSFVAAKIAGHSSREASVLGILMNTRGLVELIVLNIGLQIGVLTPTLFAILVIMALVTTFMTGPLLRLVPPKT